MRGLTIPVICSLVFNAVTLGKVWSADWTVMVYMGADNGLSDQAYRNLSQMTAVGSTDRVNIVVQMDNSDQDSLPGTKRYLVEQSRARLLNNLGKLDMADPQTLVDFAGFVGRNYPAKNYFLVLWDHGNGWPKDNRTHGPNRSIIDDGSAGHSMGVADGELKRAIVGAEEVLGKKIAIVGFDACLMNMIEVGCEIETGARIMLGSEGMVPEPGWPYEAVLGIIADNPDESFRDLAAQIVTAYSDTYQELNVTFSAVDLDQLSGAIEPLGNLVSTLAAVGPNSVVTAARETVQTFPKFNDVPPGRTDEYIDLIDFIGKIKNLPATAAQAATCLDLLQKSIIKVASAGWFRPQACGISIWFPYYWLSFKRQFNSYGKLGFSGSVPWLKFLNAFYGSDDIAPAPPQFTDAEIGENNSDRLFWSRSFDLSGVNYELRELGGVKAVFSDPADSTGNWNCQGFSLSNQYAHSQPSSFFSGTGSDLDNQLTLKRSLALAHGGLLSFFVLYNIEESYNGKHDVLYVETSTDGGAWARIDSLYGDSLAWTERRYFVEPAESLVVRFRYKTDGSDDWLGAFVDDIKIYAFDAMRTIRSEYPDTSFSFFNEPAGDYCYGVSAADAYGNRSSVSQFYELLASDYVPPFSVPSPFFDTCQIVCDFPDGNQPQVYIYTINGELIRKFPFSAIINKRLTWDGKNETGKKVASGIYLVLVKDRDFSRLGKIVRVR